MRQKSILLLSGIKYWVLLAGAIMVFIIANYETKGDVVEGISGGAEAQMSAGGASERDPYGLYGGGSGTIVPANAAYSNIDAYPSSGQINSAASPQGYAPSAPAPPAEGQPGVGHNGAATDEAYRRYVLQQQAYQAGMQAGQQRRRWPWPLSMIFGP